jgi:hypothetical protein
MNIFRTWINPATFIKIGFEDIKYSISHPLQHLLINTLSLDLQENIIKGTIPANMEETTINRMIEEYQTNAIKIIVYGKNATDDSPEKKAKQLLSLGFSEVFVYSGGIFEWFLLQEIYGQSEFPTTLSTKGNPVDLLKYRPEKHLNLLRLGF